MIEVANSLPLTVEFTYTLPQIPNRQSQNNELIDFQRRARNALLQPASTPDNRPYRRYTWAITKHGYLDKMAVRQSDEGSEEGHVRA